MNGIKLLLVVCIMLHMTTHHAQVHPCGYDLIISSHLQEFENSNRTKYTSEKEDRVSFRGEIVIPVVFHIVWFHQKENISEEILVRQIQILNEDFNAQNPNIQNIPDEFKPFVGNANIRFCLAGQDPTGKPSNGIVRVKTSVLHVASPYVDYIFFSNKGGSDAWDTDRYLNVWIATTGNEFKGYASLPWLSGKEKGGIVIDPKVYSTDESEDSVFLNKRLIVHEVGHYLGLQHLWGYDMFFRPTCAYDDGVEDTPRQLVPHLACPEYPQISCENTDMTMNFMNYTADYCIYMFTRGQVARMYQALSLFLPELGRGDIPCIEQNPDRELEHLSMSVWPNPTKAKSRIKVEFSKNVAETGIVEIWSMYGQKMDSRFYILRNKMEIEIPYLPPGAYVLKTGSVVTKFIIVE